MFIAHTRPGTEAFEIDWRVIEEFEFVYILQGEGKIQILDRAFDYKPNTLLLIPPYIRHCFFDSCSPIAHHAVHFVFYPGYEEQFFLNQSMKDGFDDVHVVFGSGLELPLYVNNPPMEFPLLFERIVRYKAERDSGMYPAATLHLKEALLALLAAVIGFAARKGEEEMCRLALSRSYMEQNFRQKMDIATLGALEGLSGNYFITSFRKTYGISPIQYLRRLRIRHSIELLHDKGRSIKAIAADCGFEDPYYFSRVFKAIQGLSPEQYRRRLF